MFGLQVQWYAMTRCVQSFPQTTTRRVCVCVCFFQADCKVHLYNLEDSCAAWVWLLPNHSWVDKEKGPLSARGISSLGKTATSQWSWHGFWQFCCSFAVSYLQVCLGKLEKTAHVLKPSLGLLKTFCYFGPLGFSSKSKNPSVSLFVHKDA